jgi:D-alanyl-D-alanine carboxypeptidase
MSPNSAAAEVRIYELLTHTSGISDYAEDPDGAKTKSVAKTPEEMLASIARVTPKLQFKPGSKWAYSNSNYVLLGLIAERVTGQPLAALFRQRLFAPAKLQVTTFDNPTTSSSTVPTDTGGTRRLKAVSATRTGSARRSRGRPAAFEVRRETSFAGNTPCSAARS